MNKNLLKDFSDLADESASWGSKIFGTPHQFSNSPGHGYTSYHQAFEMVQGKYKGFTYKEIHINKPDYPMDPKMRKLFQLKDTRIYWKMRASKIK